MANSLTHLDQAGQARMVDVGDKPVTAREAVAEGRVRMKEETFRKALEGDSKKGSVRAAAEFAGIMAAKRTADLIPLCHPLPLSGVTLDLSVEADGVTATATVRTTHATGVEMEAMTAVSVALLTIYDMAKALDRGMTIGDIRLRAKSGGRSGDWRA